MGRTSWSRRAIWNAQQAAQQIGRGVRAAEVKDAIADADVVDPSNNIAPEGDGFKSLNPEGVSAGQQIARLLPPGTRFVKAFGALAAESLDAMRTENGDKVAFYYATDDDAAGAAVADLITQAGRDAVRAGGVDDTARIEVFGDLHQFGGLNGRLLSKSEAETAIAKR